MTIRFWIGNAQYRSQIVVGTVTAVATNGTVTATINTKALTYTCEVGDTVDDAAAALAALCVAQDAPTEFGEISWSSDGADIIAEASTPGTPFAGMTGGLVFSAAAGATISTATQQTNSSPNDIANPLNWATGGGTTGLPVDGDSIVLQASTVSLLWNLDHFAGTWFASVTRWGDFTGQIGLPPQNVAGYREFRPQYFKFGDTTDPVTLLLGLGTGNGPQLEAWNVGTQEATLTVQSGQSIRLLGTHADNAGTVTNATVSIAVAAGETSTLASLNVDGGANVTIGEGVTFSGALTVSNGQVAVYVETASLLASNNSTVTVRSQAATYPSVIAEGGSRVIWLSDSSITDLVLQSGATLDKSGNILPITITDSEIDGGSNCQVIDPFSKITWTNATTVNGQVTSGPFTFLGPRTVKIT